MKGKLIVFEGADGSGKTTQARLLLNFLKKKKIPAVYISFPRYDDSLWGEMVRRYLDGDFGKLDEVDPYLASCLYAGDRASAADQIKKWLASGKIVICNRYVGSNMAHMGAKFKSQGEKLKYIRWLEDLEYGENKLPREDLVILLHVPIKISQRLMRGREKDIHEREVEYQKQVLDVSEMVAESRKYWAKVDCTKNGQILSKEEIHERVLAILKSRAILRTR